MDLGPCNLHARYDALLEGSWGDSFIPANESVHNRRTGYATLFQRCICIDQEIKERQNMATIIVRIYRNT